MGLSELTASVVSGIAVAPPLFGAAAVGAVLAFEAAGVPWGGPAFAACCITARESTITETTGKNRMIQRTFMEQNLYSCCGVKSYATQSKAVIPAKMRYADGDALFQSPQSLQ